MEVQRQYSKDGGALVSLVHKVYRESVLDTSIYAFGKHYTTSTLYAEYYSTIIMHRLLEHSYHENETRSLKIS